MERLTYSVSEAAEMLGISRSYAYELVKEKRIPVLEVGRRRVIPKEMLDNWIKNNTEFIDDKPL